MRTPTQRGGEREDLELKEMRGGPAATVVVVVAVVVGVVGVYILFCNKFVGD